MPTAATQQPATTPPPAPEPPLVAGHEAAVPEGIRPPQVEAGPDETTLQVRELEHQADQDLQEQRAHTLALLFLTNGRDAKNEKFRKLTNGIGLAQPELQRVTNELGTLQENGPWLTGFPETEAGQKREAAMLAAVLNLIIKDQMSAGLLRALVDGGLQYGEKNTHNQNVDEIGHFFPASNRRPKNEIKIYGAAFAEGLKPEKVLYHELGHALLVQDGVLYQWSDPAVTGQLAEPLSQAEHAALDAARSTPGQQIPWETPYVAQILKKFSQQGGDANYQKHIWEEMLAERVRLWFESDGSLGDFIQKRLMGSEMVQKRAAGTTSEATPGGSSEVKEAGESFEPVIQNLRTLLGELSGSPGSSKTHLTMVRNFVTHESQTGALPQSLEQPLKAFLEESYQLHTRFSRLLGKDNQAGRQKLVEGRALNLNGYLLDASEMEDWLEHDTLPIAQFGGGASGRNTGKTFWQWLAEAFAELTAAFGG